MKPVTENNASSDAIFIRRVIMVFGLAIGFATVWFLSDLLLLLFGSVLFAMFLKALARQLMKFGLSERLALVSAGLSFFLIIIGVVGFFGAELAQQFQELAKTLSVTTSRFMQEFESGAFGEWLKNLNPASGLQSLIPRVVAWSASVMGAFVSLALVIIGGLYIAANSRSHFNGLMTLIPPAYRANVRATFHDSGEALDRWLAGQLIAMVLVGILTGAGLWFVGVPLALALGLLAGLLNFIPYVGTLTAAIVTIVITAGQGWQVMLWAAGVMFVVQQFESYVITPFVVGRRVFITPAVGLYAIIAMGILLGPLGVLFGFPLVIVADTAIRRLYVRDALDEPIDILGEPAKRSEQAVKDQK